MGGSGKTTLASQLGAARAISQPFLGLDVVQASPGTVVRGRRDDAHRMLARLADSSGATSAISRLPLPRRAGDDNVLVARPRNGRIVRPRFYKQWQERLGDLKATLQILDNTRHVAAINENDGVEVTDAWSLLHGLGRPTGATTILLGHTPKSGNAEFSGNAAWENVARVRLFLGPVAPELARSRSRTIPAASSAAARPTPTAPHASISCGNGRVPPGAPGIRHLWRQARPRDAPGPGLPGLPRRARHPDHTAPGVVTWRQPPGITRRRIIKSARPRRCFTVKELTEPPWNALFERGPDQGRDGSCRGATNVATPPSASPGARASGKGACLDLPDGADPPTLRVVGGQTPQPPLCAGRPRSSESKDAARTQSKDASP